MQSYPSGMGVSSRVTRRLADLLRRHRNQLGTRWRKLTGGRQALLVVAYLRKNETYADLAYGFRIGTSTVFRCVHEAIELLAAQAPTLDQAIDIARRKAFVILDGSLLRIDRVGDGIGLQRTLLLRQAQVPGGERAGHRRPGRASGVDLTRTTGSTP